MRLLIGRSLILASTEMTPRSKFSRSPRRVYSDEFVEKHAFVLAFAPLDPARSVRDAPAAVRIGLATAKVATTPRTRGPRPSRLRATDHATIVRGPNLVEKNRVPADKHRGPRKLHQRRAAWLKESH
jgi:hypothetical protein